ncbi:Alpha-1 6-mannosyl-glycoprotein beta-1 2-N-acetylglucosaminyltransferase [Fasciola gigantica]|uniref:Alpha-1,6-mannosyl-glycoprotein 2-beta-N-acetylglucosaminyltransferase n=1 Tax=Fasciola gigantica TaxID=46835 RepID=A0A504YIG6_FASGI|nr:Alpha-1 6-mannosyl-glycoprotein beta-1 2-N-acetylglucosaminyltransferase [Fasciola gigantica]
MSLLKQFFVAFDSCISNSVVSHRDSVFKHHSLFCFMPFSCRLRRLMQRRFGRVGTILIVALLLLITLDIWGYWERSQLSESLLNGNITWLLTDCVSEAASVECSPDNKRLSHNLPTSAVSVPRQADQFNTEQFVTNQKLFGRLPSPSEPSLFSSPDAVFLVQVHNRFENLRALIESLSRVRGIEKALLIFSTDFFSGEFVSLIHAISFSRATYIYFPHNNQVFPDLFPGRDPRDCEANVSVQQAQRVGCLNANWYDRFKHYRDSRYSQVKHHWLWKLAFMFERLHAVRHYDGYVIFLEEDHYVVEDILHMKKLVETIWKPNEAKGMIAFGSYATQQNYKDPQVAFGPWISSRDNMGMGISRSMWNRMKPCLASFCTFDDYNWDWTLQHIGANCMLPRLEAMQLLKQTRVYHLGQCDGLHHTAANCSVRLLAQKITQTLQGPDAAYLFPSKLKVTELHKSGLRGRPNGGWSDLRDRALCMSIATGVWQPDIVEYAPHLTQHSAL